MADPTPPTITDGPVDMLTTFEGATDLVRTAIERGVIASEPVEVGDHGLVFRLYDGAVHTIDVRQHEDEPRLPTYRSGDFPFVGVASLAAYVNRYQSAHTLAFISDVYGQGLALLTKDSSVAKVVLDDHPVGEPAVGRRAHSARLVLRPTAAARRWGAALSATSIDQEQFLDLVVDGIAEIAAPDGAQLRDLIQDLHAIRSTEVKSVIRTGGEGAIQIAENVKLHAGPGDTVPFPEDLTIVLQPFAGIGETITVPVRVKPRVGNDRVVFSLTAPSLDDALAEVMSNVASHITEATELVPHWVP